MTEDASPPARRHYQRVSNNLLRFLGQCRHRGRPKHLHNNELALSINIILLQKNAKAQSIFECQLTLNFELVESESRSKSQVFNVFKLLRNVESPTKSPRQLFPIAHLHHQLSLTGGWHGECLRKSQQATRHFLKSGETESHIDLSLKFKIHENHIFTYSLTEYSPLIQLTMMSNIECKEPMSRERDVVQAADSSACLLPGALAKYAGKSLFASNIAWQWCIMVFPDAISGARQPFKAHGPPSWNREQGQPSAHFPSFSASSAMWAIAAMLAQSYELPMRSEIFSTCALPVSSIKKGRLCDCGSSWPFR